MYLIEFRSIRHELPIFLLTQTCSINVNLPFCLATPLPQFVAFLAHGTACITLRSALQILQKADAKLTWTEVSLPLRLICTATQPCTYICPPLQPVVCAHIQSHSDLWKGERVEGSWYLKSLQDVLRKVTDWFWKKTAKMWTTVRWFYGLCDGSSTLNKY